VTSDLPTDPSVTSDLPTDPSVTLDLSPTPPETQPEPLQSEPSLPSGVTSNLPADPSVTSALPTDPSATSDLPTDPSVTLDLPQPPPVTQPEPLQSEPSLPSSAAPDLPAKIFVAHLEIDGSQVDCRLPVTSTIEDLVNVVRRDFLGGISGDRMTILVGESEVSLDTELQNFEEDDLFTVQVSPEQPQTQSYTISLLIGVVPRTSTFSFRPDDSLEAIEPVVRAKWEIDDFETEFVLLHLDDDTRQVIPKHTVLSEIPIDVKHQLCLREMIIISSDSDEFDFF
jgi:hypothetical protein